MTITITAFERSLDQGAGLARDMRVRWALEEVGQPYEVRLVPWEKFKEEAHLARNPFGQIPTYEEGDLTLFESGAIVLHIAERFPGLLPKDADARARAIMWMFAALSTVEPPIVDREVVEYVEDGKSWQGERFAMVDERIRGRLNQLVRAARRWRVARRRVQRGRHYDGARAAAVGRDGDPAGVSEPRRLRRPRQGAAGL